jgi:hypothetical protein
MSGTLQKSNPQDTRRDEFAIFIGLTTNTANKNITLNTRTVEKTTKSNPLFKNGFISNWTRLTAYKT